MTSYRIGEVDFDPDASEICAQGHVTHLQPQVSSVLVCLLRHKGEVVAKDMLVEEAWHGRSTSDQSVTRCISLIRGHFADRDERHLIETIPKKGYRFTGPVEEYRLHHSSAPIESESAHLQQTQTSNVSKRAVNLIVTAAAIFLLLSGLIVASDFFTLR
ncbi:MAG: winged helix-turn-helix domain-containing protein [Halioglobus sp.]